MRRLLIRLFLIALIVAVGLAGWAGYEYRQYQEAPVIREGSTVQFDIRRGEGGRSLAATLGSAGVVIPDWRLGLIWRLRGDSPSIKAGTYEFTGPVTLQRLFDELTIGQPDKQLSIALIEGQTFAQYRALLAEAPGLKPASAGLSDREILAKIGADATHPEGWFAPDTYRYTVGSTDLDLLGRAYQLQKQRLAQAWDERDPSLPLKSPYQLLTLASIVEKETGHQPDRGLVAGVFTNRLRVGMMLQSDPTTIYGMGDKFDGNLRRRDLRTDTPYNTYTRGGLTPTPIAMPGRAALAATARPDDTRALYFVARGDGSSHFSNDLAGHNRAVNRYQRQRATLGAGQTEAASGSASTPDLPATASGDDAPAPASGVARPPSRLPAPGATAP